MKCYVFFFLVFFSFNTLAQDLKLFKEGDVLSAKDLNFIISEINSLKKKIKIIDAENYIDIDANLISFFKFDNNLKDSSGNENFLSSRESAAFGLGPKGGRDKAYVFFWE